MTLFDEFPMPTLSQWREEVERLLEGTSFEKRLQKKSYEGITLDPLYTEQALEGMGHVDSKPFQAPFLRRGTPSRSAPPGWTIAQEMDVGDPREVKAWIEEYVKGGGEAIHLVMDHAGAWTLDDFKCALSGVDLKTHPLLLQSHHLAAPLLGFCKAASLEGSLAVDPLGALASKGGLPSSLEHELDRMAELMACRPSGTVVWIHGELYHDGGASAVQELAFAAATAVFYLRALEERGIGPLEASPRFRFGFSLGSVFFTEIAKIRAFRLVWNGILEACGVEEGERRFNIHGRTSRRTGTLFDPHVNLLRATTQAFSGIVGGVDSLHLSPFDEPLGKPDAFSRRIALNTQHLLREESHLAKTLDPAGGSYYVEKLTADVAQAAWALLKQVEKRGGMDKALLDGFVQGEVARTAAMRIEAAARQKEKIVGTNRYPNPLEKTCGGTMVEQKQRSSPKPLEPIGSPLLDGIVAAVKKGASLEAIAGACAKGEPTRITPVPGQRVSEPFEKIRKAVAGHGAARVYLATLGSVNRYLPRLDFAASFFEAGGFEVIRTEGHRSPEEAVDKAFVAKAGALVICGLDADYETGALKAARRSKEKDAQVQVILAGLPRSEEEREKLLAAGVDRFIHLGADMIEILTETAGKMGVTP